jgi:hypothetical protein
MKGIIYKITCNETGEVYYGSTTMSLNNRISMHKANCKQWKEGKGSFATSFNIISRGNYSYSLIETVECEDRRQLESVERRYIENNECINKFKPCRTYEEQKEYMKEYREANKDGMKEYYDTNRKAILEQQKAYREANKETINEKRRQQRAEKKLLKEQN